MPRDGRFPAPTGDVRADARRELRWAMGGSGLTVDKVTRLRTVLSLPIVSAAMDEVAPERAAVAAFAVIVGAARDLGGSVQARLLRAALGVDSRAMART